MKWIKTLFAPKCPVAFRTAAIRMLVDCTNLGSLTPDSERQKVYVYIAAVGFGRLLDAELRETVEDILRAGHASKEFRQRVTATRIVKNRI